MNLAKQMFKNNRVVILGVSGLLVLLIVAGLLWQAEQESEDFEAIIQEIAVVTLKDNPEVLLYLGVEEADGIRWDPTKLTDLSDADYKQRNDNLTDLLRKLNAYDAAKLSPEDKLTYDIVKWELGAELQLNPYSDLNTDEYLLLSNFPPYFANNYPIRNYEDATNYNQALIGFSNKMAHFIDRIQERKRKGIIPPYETLRQMLANYESLRNTKPEQTILYTLYAEKLANLQLDSSKEEELKRALLQTIVDHILTSYGKLADLIKNDLMKQASGSQGIWSQPGGSEYYSARLRAATGTDLDPLEVHELAKRKVEEIVKEIRSQTSEQTQDTAAANSLLSGEELLQAVSGHPGKIMPSLSDWFDDELITDNPVDVRSYPVPFSGAGAFYIPLSVDGSRDGRFFLPLDNAIPASLAHLLAVHEGVPGHHLQISIQYDSPTIPLVRKANLLPGFVEGWAVYAETLCADSGLLDPVTVQSHLLNSYLGAVVDTGINGLKWTREQANENITSLIGTGSDDLIDSVIAFPGLLSSYAIGYDQFQSFREKAEDELQDRFDLKAFHSVLLRNGTMPFPILEQQVNQYIESVN
ncbi:hypothetical protein B1A99_31740 [Cohnella sp. CIP 111063]|uniref:DUF885 domain-containing protein n=1 Tax=unclassified Cohnella TaxID=2636738 RepID=UPI000B8BFE88|nr:MULTISPECIES: DUF885 domain-containing protein [unclassified Cohnella]OXS52928.1 hypothetical protein B1A99_31740 [Cohnella sp. CIP 111063]PRX60181.1 uncharacterized protein (DUF885 family) [Cohnella sp. SGD-V74]